MKKILLLSGAALLLATNAEAMGHNSYMSELKPYIGAEYVYSKAKLGGTAGSMKDNFNSMKGDLGIEWYKNMDTEFSYQQSWQVKNKNAFEGRSVKQRFAAYAMDLYGKMPIMCSPLSAVLTGGLALYDVTQKGLPDKSFQRVGYRIGGGMQYDMSDHWAARVIGRYSYVGANRLNNLKEVTAGLLYRF